jgi:polynucleotide 5'-kinase involved in rRNA processing
MGTPVTPVTPVTLDGAAKRRKNSRMSRFHSNKQLSLPPGQAPRAQRSRQLTRERKARYRQRQLDDEAVVHIVIKVRPTAAALIAAGRIDREASAELANVEKALQKLHDDLIARWLLTGGAELL